MNLRWSYEDETSTVRSCIRKGASVPLAKCIYASRLLGTSKDLVLHGGGNTSVKTRAKNIFDQPINGLFIKGSGNDLSDIDIDGFTGLDLDSLKKLESLNDLEDDQMLTSFSQAKLELKSARPSVETLIHAFLPAPYIFHTHANSVLAITNQPNGKKYASKIFAPNAIVLPYVISGFRLAKNASSAFREYPNAKAIVVINHGIFSLGSSAKEAFDNMMYFVRQAESEIKRAQKKVFESRIVKPNTSSKYILAPLLRGVLGNSKSENQSVILEFRTNRTIRNFVDGRELNRYANAGPVTPDHVIWTKSKPLIIPSSADFKLIQRKVKKYREIYKQYFETNNRRYGNSKTIRETLPRVVLVPGLGLFGVGDTSVAAKIRADLAENWVKVITEAESIGTFTPAKNKDFFDIEYWAPEAAKIGITERLPLKGHVALVTGGGSGIGKATARAFRQAGAEIVILDINTKATKVVANEIGGLGLVVDVTDHIAVRRAFKEVVSYYGGVDIVISNAGKAWHGEIGTVSNSVLRDSFELNFFAHQTIAQNAVQIMRLQHQAGGSGGCILFNTSKQAVNPGKDFGPYGLPKAATLFLIRQYALDHGKDGIRTGGVNADRVRSGLLTDGMIARRSNARQLSKEEYLTGNLLEREVMADDVAKAFLDLALSPSTTGAILTVDGGNIEAALR